MSAAVEEASPANGGDDNRGVDLGILDAAQQLITMTMPLKSRVRTTMKRMMTTAATV